MCVCVCIRIDYSWAGHPGLTLKHAWTEQKEKRPNVANCRIRVGDLYFNKQVYMINKVGVFWGFYWVVNVFYYYWFITFTALLLFNNKNTTVATSSTNIFLFLLLLLLLISPISIFFFTIITTSISISWVFLVWSLWSLLLFYCFCFHFSGMAGKGSTPLSFSGIIPRNPLSISPADSKLTPDHHLLRALTYKPTTSPFLNSF